jgi:hypothetical protein
MDEHILTGNAVERHFDFNKALFDFSELFKYDRGDDRAIVIVGGTFLEIALEHILYSFLPEENKEVERLMEYNQPLGTFSSKIAMCYCLGLIDEVIKHDLTLIRKIRNEFAHDLYASFDNEKIPSWCRSLKWHKIMIFRPTPEDAGNRDLFQVGVHTLISHLHGCISMARSEKRKIKNDLSR